MLAKWIVCTVDPSDRDRFFEAQCQWKALGRAEGFVAQVGGWETRRTHLACILGLWRDEPAYTHFMDRLHDPIVEKNEQHNTYRNIEVALGPVRMEIAGVSHELDAAFKAGCILRVADCELHPRRVEHFETVQRQIWNRAMAETGAVAGGIFAKLGATQDRYLVATLWLDERAHADYARTQVPQLRQRAQVEKDVATLTGYCVRLESNWSVLPANR